ncbi:AI-2E family transporter [Bradyrhizobium ottawaense]|uniref:AI-2E family transporter n=1 Tax=Bradyrhizobium ottawaense TaxID=931866 RepID=UPI003FA18652
MGYDSKSGQNSAAPPSAPKVDSPGREQPAPGTQPSNPLSLLEKYLSPVLSPFATFGIIVVVAIFVLLQKEDLRDRMIRLFGSTDLHRTTVVMDDAAKRLSRYFLAQLGLNSAFGVVIGVGLYFIGVPNPLLSGMRRTRPLACFFHNFQYANHHCSWIFQAAPHDLIERTSLQTDSSLRPECRQ